MTRRPIAALAALAAAALAGCSPGGDSVARVGDAVITAEDFTIAAKQSGSQYATFGDSAKFVFVDDLVKRQLLIEGAKAAGLYRDSTFLEFSAAARERAARDAMLRSYQGGTIGVSEAEARALHARLSVENHVRVIVTTTRAMAVAAKERLDRGAAFERIADLYNTTGMTPPGGDAGWLAAGVLPPVLDAILNTVPVGQLVGPLESPGQGWFLMRVDGRRDVTPAPYEELRSTIVDRLRQRKARAAFTRAVERLRAEYEVRLADGAADRLAQALSGPLDAGMGRLAPGAADRLDLAARASALGTYRGGVFTLGDAVTELERGGGAPNLAMTPQVERWIESQTLTRALAAEARARHVPEDPAVVRTARAQEEGFLLDAYYTREVAAGLVVDEAALQAEYAMRQRELSRIEAAQVAWVALADSNAAIAVAMAIRSGAAQSLAGAVSQAAPSAPMHTEVVRFPNPDPFWMTQSGNLTRMREGTVAGPFPAMDGYRFVQLLTRQLQVPRWDELDPQVLQQLQSLVIERQRETRFRALTDSLRRVFPVAVDRAKVERLEWPVEAMIPPGMGMPGGG